MSLKIEITVPEDTVAADGAADYLASALSAIGFSKRGGGIPAGPLVLPEFDQRIPADRPHQKALQTATEAAEADTKDPEPVKPARRGRPPKAKPEPAPEPAAEAPQISTGEERVGPEDDIEEIDEEAAAQDAADEQTEADAKADPAKPLTHDDIRNLLGDYVKLYGMAAAQADGPVVLRERFAAVHENREKEERAAGKLKPNENYTMKISDIPDTQEDLGRALAAFREMMTSNRFGRKAAG